MIDFLKLRFLLLILLLPFAMLAQDEITPLLERLEVSSGNAKVDLLNEISVTYRRSDRYKSLDYAREAFDNSLTARYLPGQALALKNEGICWFFIGNNDSATYCYTKALDVFTRINDLVGNVSLLQ